MISTLLRRQPVKYLDFSGRFRSSLSASSNLPFTNHYYLSRRLSTTMASMAEDNAVRFKLVFFVPHSHLEACKDAVFDTGAGSFPQGKYSRACFQTPGVGQFLPGTGATPNIGAVGALEKVEEMKVEVLCIGRPTMTKAVEALLKAHPYEEPAYDVYKMENV